MQQGNSYANVGNLAAAQISGQRPTPTLEDIALQIDTVSAQLAGINATVSGNADRILGSIPVECSLSENEATGSAIPLMRLLADKLEGLRIVVNKLEANANRLNSI